MTASITCSLCLNKAEGLKHQFEVKIATKSDQNYMKLVISQEPHRHLTEPSRCELMLWGFCDQFVITKLLLLFQGYLFSSPFSISKLNLYHCFLYFIVCMFQLYTYSLLFMYCSERYRNHCSASALDINIIESGAAAGITGCQLIRFGDTELCW